MITRPGISEVWADTAAGGDISNPADGLKHSGYTGTPAPVYQYVNWLLNYLFNGVRHLLIQGIPSWHADESYTGGEIVQHGFVVYVAISPSTGQTPPNITYWAKWGHLDSEVETLAQGVVDDAFEEIDASSLVTTSTPDCTISNAKIRMINGKKRLTYQANGNVYTAQTIAVDLSGAADFVPTSLTWSVATTDGGTIASSQILLSAHTQTIYTENNGTVGYSVCVVSEE